jgi:hypothetical protein
MAGYSGTPLVNKLGLKSGMTLFTFNSPADYFKWLSPLPADVLVKDKLTDELDFIHVFVREFKVFQKQFLTAKRHLKKDGMLWISWPKKSAKVPTDLDENIIRKFGLDEGLVDVKVCAVDDVWSGLKFVYRIKDR